MMLSSQNVAIVKIPFRLRVMAFFSNCPLFLFLWERGFLIGNSAHTEALMVSVVASNISNATLIN